MSNKHRHNDRSQMPGNSSGERNPQGDVHPRDSTSQTGSLKSNRSCSSTASSRTDRKATLAGLLVKQETAQKKALLAQKRLNLDLRLEQLRIEGELQAAIAQDKIYGEAEEENTEVVFGTPTALQLPSNPGYLSPIQSMDRIGKPLAQETIIGQEPVGERHWESLTPSVPLHQQSAGEPEAEHEYDHLGEEYWALPMLSAQACSSAQRPAGDLERPPSSLA